VRYGERCPTHPVAAGTFADKRRGSRQSRGYGREWEIKRERILARDEGLCQPCLKGEPERVTVAVAVDHIVAKADAARLGWSIDQTEADSNLQSICKTCHDAKSADEARRGRGGRIFTDLLAGPML
jgi:5-methylcytosine-specific restriction protein A